MKVSERKRHSRYISVGEISKKLPLNEPMTVKQFAKFTGISERSANARVNRLVNDGCLTKEASGNVIVVYMTKGNKKNMDKIHAKNVAKKGKRGLLSVTPTDKEMALIEHAAHIERCDRILVAAGLL